jgi:Zn-dependent protease
MFSGLSGVDIVVVFVSLVISMTLHEAMHGFVAHWLGDTTAEEAGRLTLNPFRHIDTLTTLLLPLVLITLGLPPIFAAKPVPFNPYRVKYGEFGVALVGIAGPVTNFVLAFVASVIMKLIDPTSDVFTWLGLFLEVNVAFFVFNMIPIPPLDGSRLLYAFAPDFLRDIMARVETAGLGIIFVFVAVFALFPGAGNFLASLDTSVINFLLLH